MAEILARQDAEAALVAMGEEKARDQGAGGGERPAAERGMVRYAVVTTQTMGLPLW